MSRERAWRILPLVGARMLGAVTVILVPAVVAPVAPRGWPRLIANLPCTVPGTVARGTARIRDGCRLRVHCRLNTGDRRCRRQNNCCPPPLPGSSGLHPSRIDGEFRVPSSLSIASGASVERVS